MSSMSTIRKIMVRIMHELHSILIIRSGAKIQIFTPKTNEIHMYLYAGIDNLNEKIVCYEFKLSILYPVVGV